jgi:lambda family phage tail tape measure protein
MALEMFNVRAVLQGSVVGTDQYARFNNQLTSIGKNADVVNKQMGQLNGTIQKLAAGLGGFQLGSFVADFAKASIQLDAFEKQLSMGFGGAATIELENLRNIMRELGISQEESLGSAVRFTSSLKLAGKEANEANKIFESASKLILANKLSADGAQRVYYAMSQIASKGKLMSEELQGQLAENLAGITQQVSAAMLQPTMELLKNMKEGKVTSDQFFEAMMKIAEDIDPANLQSAAQSLGKLKNAWFDFKAGILDVKDIKVALDGVTAAVKLLADNVSTVATVLTTVVIAAISRYTVTKIQSVAASVAAAAATRAEIAAELAKAQVAASVAAQKLAYLQQEMILTTRNASIKQNALAQENIGQARNLAAARAANAAAVAHLAQVTAAARAAGVGMTAFGRAAQSVMGVFGGPWGLALTGATLAITYFATRTTDAEKATNAWSQAQTDMAAVIDITTGKIKTQNQELILQARLSAEEAKKTTAAAFEQTRGKTFQKLTENLAPFGSEISPELERAENALMNLASAAKDGSIAGTELQKGIENLYKRFPVLRGSVADVNSVLSEYTAQYLAATRAQINFQMLAGMPFDRTQAQDFGLLAPGSNAIQAEAGKPDTDAYNDVKKNLMLLREQRSGTERQAFITEQLTKAKLAEFDATGKLVKVAGQYSSEIENLAGKAFDANKAFQSQKEAVSQLNTMYGQVTELQFRLGYMDEFGVKAASSQEAIVQFRIAHGDLKNASKEVQLQSLSTAKAVDLYSESLKQASESNELENSLGKQAADYQQRIYFFQQFGDKAETTQEAIVRFRISQGDLANQSDETKNKLLEQARAVDVLASRYNDLQENAKMAQNVIAFRQFAGGRVKDLQQRQLALMGGDSKSLERADFSRDLSDKIDEYRQAAVASNRSALDLVLYSNQLEAERVAALEEFDRQQKIITAMEGDWTVGAKQAIKSYGDEIANVAQASARAWENAFRATEDALVGFVMTGKLNFRDLASSIISDLVRIAIQQSIMRPLAGFLGLGFANGGVFSGGQVQAFANGGIVTKPTLFPMASGAGLMGEAGPEAIMPLKRLSSGKLGVEATGGGVQNVTVNVSVEKQSMQTTGDSNMAANLGKAIANAVRAELVVQKRPGGLLA